MAMTSRDHEERDGRLIYVSRVRRARCMIVLAVIVALEIYGRLLADPAFLQSPSQVLYAWLFTVLSDGRITSALAMAAFEIASAYALSLIFGAAIGLAIG
ncbi:MAG: hypothetical protein J2P54_17395, partial [Bradyrhizobiaceae bacterium]|nr:hypothetical protein [Bradyrhizobiaceae bacterium]